MPAKNPTERSLVASIAANTKWAACPDRSAATRAARNAFNQRFELEVDPAGVLTPDERSRRASWARRAYYTKLSLKSAQARRGITELTTEAETVEAELDSVAGDAA